MQKLIIIGNLTRDPESRTTQDGKTVCNFTVAVNRRGQKDENGNNLADFFRVSAWGKIGEVCQKWLTKGKKVNVVGQVSVHAYQGQNGQAQASLDVFAQEVEFLSPVGDGQAQHGSSEPTDVTGQVAGELPF